ncbi:MAG TPA: TauD/TfdA family dioxygenase [Myxococcota bacterium]|nr:TauD/TfdA family dioxygenase [Myxococcota bacterium]
MAYRIEPLSPLGARVEVTDPDALLASPTAPGELLHALETHGGVLVFPRLGLDAPTQLAFARRMGDVVVKTSAGWSRAHPGVYRVALDPAANDEFFVKGSWDWHIDGATSLGIPPKASLLACRTKPSAGGDTQFVDTYAAYDRLTAEEKRRFESLKVWHRIELDAYSTPMNLSPESLARLESEPAHLHPLIWTHRDGRKSLVIGVTATQVEGLPKAEGRALLRSLVDRATEPRYVLNHVWSVGDLVIWDNRGTMHRARPFEADSGRDMYRVMLEGDEPIQ